MVKLYVEGGGDAAALKTSCRQGFTEFITKAGVKNRPRVVACGSRQDAYDSFCIAIANGEKAMLLVDSEAAVSDGSQNGAPENRSPWAHLKQRSGDDWDKPNKAQDRDCHLMVQVMESWFLADRDSLKSFFNQGFQENQLPAATRPIESVSKSDVYSGLRNATADCKTKATYGKGEHSFKLLALIDPNKVANASPWANRFINELKKKMDA